MLDNSFISKYLCEYKKKAMGCFKGKKKQLAKEMDLGGGGKFQ